MKKVWRWKIGPYHIALEIGKRSGLADMTGLWVEVWWWREDGKEPEYA